ncbi:putative Aldo-keto reductase family 1 member C18 [Hypsibius exemplaris]|uniref:Aldo-keto reductase family 1 member C18 n=1 Tax=Hypsibius exemplaris TaxID=2072580 RepID=A0A1W0X520_HYPEX|nr:putative Aldo-keto reductase family 1 member C18 [Hypsibius exemplaris]
MSGTDGVRVPSVKLNSSGSIPVLGLGTSRGTREAVEYAIDIGYRHFDSAYACRTEAEVEAAIEKKIQEGVVKREDLFVTTKLFNTFHRPELVLRAIQMSLAALKLGYVDLYLMHKPIAFKYIDDNPTIPKDANGNYLYNDVDTADTWKVESHAYLMQPDLFDYCKTNGIVLVAFASVGSPGRRNKTKDEAVLSEDPIVVKIAKRLGKRPSQIERGRIPIPRSTNPAHIKENIEVCDFDLTPADLAELGSLDRQLRFFGMAEHKNSPNFPYNDGK